MNILKKHLEFAIKDDVVDNISVKYLFFDKTYGNKSRL
tara:strand:+ start:65 stop:178 length:114 start_codon:yes stop_codon:yes gene_type:complete